MVVCLSALDAPNISPITHFCVAFFFVTLEWTGDDQVIRVKIPYGDMVDITMGATVAQVSVVCACVCVFLVAPPTPQPPLPGLGEWHQPGDHRHPRRAHEAQR